MTKITAEQARDIRRQLGLSQKEMSLLLGLGAEKSTVSRYERAEINIRGAASVVYQLLATNTVTPKQIWQMNEVAKRDFGRPMCAAEK
jgi:transcriptional regulator with XRE-family HTH domain